MIGMILDGLWDPYTEAHMGTCAEAHAAKHGITREEQDAHALASHQRAGRAAEAGFSGRVRLQLLRCKRPSHCEQTTCKRCV